ncbi:MAG: ABC transporter permease [Ruminococcus flavefaciens]|nr:ABC transporter permease [Ruminococcus flavefaciens]MCM1393209.1 ABC transporter permease [Ruminococcus sp.]
MTKVNNGEAIRRLAVRQMKSNRKMNAVVIFSIILTCILFTALTSIGGSLINGVQQETMRQVGGDRMAGLKCVLPEDYEKVQSDKAVKDAVYRIIVGNAVNEDFRNISVEVNCAGDANAAKAMFCMPTEGRLPEKYNEIAVSTLVLDELKLPYELGITVPITLDVNGNTSEHNFTLCGYWQGERLAMAQECWVSREFSDSVAPIPTESFYSLEYINYAGYLAVDFNFSNSWNIEGKMDKLISRLYADTDSELIPNVGINWAYTTSEIDPATVIGAIVILLVIFAAGYLIIYNIFHINISANIRSYGLLKTIGTTSKQIKRMVRIQAAIYSAIGIPLGLVIGIMLGKMLLGAIMKTMSIGTEAGYTLNAMLLLIVCIIAAVFTFITVMISCQKPCRTASSVTPIEALRYNETYIGSNKTDKKTGKITPFSIAQSNIARSKKKIGVVVISLTLSIILVNTLFTVLQGVDIDKFISNLIIGDFIIKQESLDNTGEYNIVSQEELQYLSGIDGVEELNSVYFERGSIELTGKSLEKAQKLAEKYAADDKYGGFNSITEKYISADIYGITPTLLNNLEPIQGELDIEKFKSGKYAVVYTQYIDIDEKSSEDDFYEVGDTISISVLNADSNFSETLRSYEVMAVCEMPFALSTQSYTLLYGHVIIPEQEYFSLSDNNKAMNVTIQAEPDKIDNVDTQIRYMTDRDDSHLIVTSKQTYKDAYIDFMQMIKLVGGTLSGILALIGILNFVNAVVTGIITRKHDFAMMSAVGMTGKQMKAMLMWEGVHYAFLTAICSILLGTLLSIFIINGIASELFFFTYHFTLVPIFICIAILVLLSVIIPTISYNTICNGSVVDRLRRTE